MSGAFQVPVHQCVQSRHDLEMARIFLAQCHGICSTVSLCVLTSILTINTLNPVILSLKTSAVTFLMLSTTIEKPPGTVLTKMLVSSAEEDRKGEGNNSTNIFKFVRRKLL